MMPEVNCKTCDFTFNIDTMHSVCMSCDNNNSEWRKNGLTEGELLKQKIEELSTTSEHDAVTYPAHYTQHPSGVEQIELSEHMTFNVGNAFKYLHRAALKGNQQQDLEKAAWYIEREKGRISKGYSPKEFEEPHDGYTAANRYFKHEDCPVRRALWNYTIFEDAYELNKATDELKKLMQAKQEENVKCGICGEVLTPKDEMVENPETGEWCCADHWHQEEPC